MIQWVAYQRKKSYLHRSIYLQNPAGKRCHKYSIKKCFHSGHSWRLLNIYISYTSVIPKRIDLGWSAYGRPKSSLNKLHQRLHKNHNNLSRLFELERRSSGILQRNRPLVKRWDLYQKLQENTSARRRKQGIPFIIFVEMQSSLVKQSNYYPPNLL